MTEKVKLVDLNKLLTCILCKGYFIDATTIIECLHSFCRTCIVRYLQVNKFCPSCEVQVHKTRPLLNIRSDQTLQDIVYKLVPGLFKNEMKRRRDFYRQKDELVQSSIPSSSEKRGDVWGCDRLIFTPEDTISVSLEYSSLYQQLPLNLPTNIHLSKEKDTYQSHKRYLNCPGALKVYHIKKLLRGKFGMLNSKDNIDVLYRHDILKDEYTLVDLAYIYSWKRSEPLRLFYKVTQESKPNELPENTELLENVSTTSSPTCSIVSITSPSPSMAAAPSSRHPSPPPSPQIAHEPNDVKLENPNSALMPSPPNFKLHVAALPEVKLKSALKKPLNGYGIVKNADKFTKKLTNASEMAINAMKVPSSIHSKKRVTFSLDLVKDCYLSHNLKAKTPKYSGHRNLFRFDPLNGSSIKEVIHLRNKVLSHKSS